MIILVAGEKGGVGKSAIAQNLAVSIKLAGGDIVLIDTDPQDTSFDWAAEREERLKGINPAAIIPRLKARGNIREWLIEQAKRYDHLIVDTGGADSEALRSAMTVADLMITPFRPKRRDLKTLPKVSELVKLATAVNPGLQVRALITQCPSLPSQVVRILDAKEACRSYGIATLDAVTMARNIYDDADEDGSSVLESTVDDKAVEEIRNIATELWGDMKWRA
jgi:chromosome partitioning protein